MSAPPDYLLRAIQDYAYAKHDWLRSETAGVYTHVHEANRELNLCREAMYAAIKKYGDECAKGGPK